MLCFHKSQKYLCDDSLGCLQTKPRDLIDVYTGYPSSMHDASVFANSKLGRNLERLLAGTSYHLVADSAYELITVVMKPYQDTGRLDDVI